MKKNLWKAIASESLVGGLKLPYISKTNNQNENLDLKRERARIHWNS